MSEFIGFPKIPRLFREVVITEKIDGTNGCIVIEEPTMTNAGIFTKFQVYAQSRKRLVTPEDDNHGFARWVADNAITLVEDLGVGRHFGEWWGQGINRGYGLKEKRFSLFNTKRWSDQSFLTPNLTVVPVIWTGRFSDVDIYDSLYELRYDGSLAAPGFMDPEGIVIYHSAANQMFKVTLENDDQPKEVAARAVA